MKNSKKILIITSEFPPQPGGIGNHAFNLATQLQLNGYQVGVMADVRSKDGWVEQQFDVKLPFEVFRTKRHPISLITYVKRILIFKKVAKEYSILFASGKFSLWLIGFFPFKNKKLKLAVIHGSEVNLKGLFKKFTDKALLKFDKIIAVSNFTKSFVNHLKLKDVRIIPNGFEIDNFEKADIGTNLMGYPKLITVGAVNDRKGQHNVIEKLPTLIKIYPKIHYHIVGIPSEKEKLLRLAGALDIEAHITFHGVLPQLKLTEVLSKSDIFVMLSEQTVLGGVEGFGIALLEANYMGLPTIGAKGCGIEDAIMDFKTGILVDYDNAIAFENAIRIILENKNFYIENSKKWAFYHTWEIIIKDYIKLL